MAGHCSVLRRVSPLFEPDWDAKIENLAGRTFFHGSAWARVLYHTYGFEPVYFIAGSGGSIDGVLPAMEVNSWLTGKRGVSLPFTDECEPLDGANDSFPKVWGPARDFARARRWKYLELRGGAEKLGGPLPSTRFFGHKLNLQLPESTLLGRFDSAVRRAIRKAEQHKLSIESSNHMAAVEAFHRLLCKTRKRQGVPPQPFRFFRNIHEYVLAKNQGRVMLVRYQGEAVAGAIFFESRKTVVFKFGASNEAYQHLRPNNLLMWSAIRMYRNKGFEQLDFGRTSLENRGLRKFKLSWGSAEYPIGYHRYNVHTRAFDIAKDHSSGWYNRVFHSLPIGISRLLGAIFYNHAA